jgi:hypothetical protein
MERHFLQVWAGSVPQGEGNDVIGRDRFPILVAQQAFEQHARHEQHPADVDLSSVSEFWETVDRVAETYHQKVADPQTPLLTPDGGEVLEAARSLSGSLCIRRRTNQAWRLSWSERSPRWSTWPANNTKQTAPNRGLSECSVKVVAGVRNRRSHHSTVVI